MNKFFRITLCFLLIVNMFACKNEPSAEQQAPLRGPGDLPHSATSTPDGKLLGFRDNIMTIEGQAAKKFETDSNEVTVIMLRPAETLPTRPSLSPAGQMRADLLAKVFVLSGIQQIYTEGNPGMQTGNMTSRSNYCSLGIVKDDGTDQLSKILLNSYKGKTVMVIGNPNMMTNMLDQLAGPGKYVMPENEYDHVFIVKAKAMGDSKVYHFTY